MMRLLLIGIVVIVIILLVLLLSRSQALQRFAVLEFLLITTVALAVMLGYIRAQEFAEEQYFSMLSTCLEDARELVRNSETGIVAGSRVDWQTLGEDLESLLARDLPAVQIGDEAYPYLATAVYQRTEEDRYSVQIYHQANTGSLSEEECLSYIQRYAEEAIRLGTVVTKKTDGNTGVLIYAGRGMVSPEGVYLTEVSLKTLQTASEDLLNEYLFYGLLFLLIGTTILACIIAMQGRQLRKLTRYIVRVAEGREDWTSLEQKTGSSWLESNEIRGLKNSLRQVVSDMAKTSYRQYRVLQGYYRFAPKQIEKILGRNSILEVDINDSVHISGTLAVVSCPEHNRLGEREYLRRLTREYEELEEKQKEYGGILLSDSSDLTTMQLLFREETKKALQFGVDITADNKTEQREQFFVLLHRTAFVYGVAGSEEQAFTFLLSREMKVLGKYVERFRAAGVRMAVTDAVYELVEKETTGRYIGYLESDGLTFKIYEILDAYPAGERQKRIDTKDRFEQALNLFYQEDYYLGRNLFTEVLKECPDDEVAKWYLFLCERCLNAEYGNSGSGALFSD